MANTSSTSTLPEEIKTHYILKLLMRAYPRLIHGRFLQKATIPRRGGNTAEWRRFGSLNAVSTPLGETDWGHGGTAPAPEAVSVTTIQASPDTYGSYIEYSDDIEFQAIDDVVMAYSDILGEQAGKSVDILTRTELVTNLSVVVRPNGRATDSEIVAGDNMDFATFAAAVGTLAGNDALPIQGDKYIMITHPYVWADMIQDPDIQAAFQAAARAEGRNPFATGFIGSLLNVDIYQTSLAYVDAGAGGGNPPIDVYYSIFLGQEAAGTLGLEGKTPKDVVDGGPGMRSGTGKKIRNVDFILKPPGYRDPFNEIGTVAWKTNHAAKVLNANFAVVARTAASLG